LATPGIAALARREHIDLDQRFSDSAIQRFSDSAIMRR